MKSFKFIITSFALIFFSVRSHAGLECYQYDVHELEIGQSIEILTSPTEKYCVIVNDTNNTGSMTYVGYTQSEYYYEMYIERARGYRKTLNAYGGGNFITEDIQFSGRSARIIIGRSPLLNYNSPSTFIPLIVTLTTKVEHGETVLIAITTVADNVNSSVSSQSSVKSLEAVEPFSNYTIQSNSQCSNANTSPDSKPTRANLNANIRRMVELKNFAYSSTLESPVSDAFLLAYFYHSVKNGSTMDYKQLGSQFEDFGNYNYGAVGRALGIPAQVLKRGAGWAQMRAGTSESTYGHYLWQAPYGDDPADQAWIEKGIDYYDSVFSAASLSQRNNAGKDGRTDFCNDKHNDPIEGGENDSGAGFDGDLYPFGPDEYYIPPGIRFCQHGFCNNLCVGTVTITDIYGP